MVIYLRTKSNIFIKLIIVILLLGLIFGGGYYISYFKYSDKELVDYEALKTQNRLLQAELEEVNNFKELEGDYLIGKVVVRNIHDFYNEVVINLGSDDGIYDGDAVINSEGLVGIVDKVDKKTAVVKLLTGNYNVSVKINELYGNLNGGKVTLLDKFKEVDGDKVYTSGYSKIPEGIYVGTIINVKMDNNDLGKEVNVKLIDNTNLNYVAVIRSLA